MTEQELKQALINAMNATHNAFSALDEYSQSNHDGGMVLRWIPVTERMPQSDDQLVVVRTNSGAKYFSRTINGKFINNVVDWFPIPEQ